MVDILEFDPVNSGWSWADLPFDQEEAFKEPVGAEVSLYDPRKDTLPRIRTFSATATGVDVVGAIARQAAAFGANVRYVDGWANRGYVPLTGLGGMIDHWIVSNFTGGAGNALGMIVNGHSTLNGPLANFRVDFFGGIDVVAGKSANHGGVGSHDGISGNNRWLGTECEGGPIMQPGTLKGLAILNAATIKVIAGARIISHQEYAPKRKVDIGGYISPVRNEAQLIARGGGATTPVENVISEAIGGFEDMKAYFFVGSDGKVFIGNLFGFDHVRTESELKDRLSVLTRSGVQCLAWNGNGWSAVTTAFEVMKQPKVANPYAFGFDVARPGRGA